MATQLTSEEQYAFDEAIANLFSNSKYSQYLFYAHCLSQMKVHFDHSLESIAAMNFTYDHFNLYINPSVSISLKQKDGSFPKDDKGNEVKSIPGFSGLPLEQRLGVLLHEVMHMIYGHWHRRQDRAHEAFNYAADCALNQFIKRTHLEGDVTRQVSLRDLIRSLLLQNPSKQEYISNKTYKNLQELYDDLVTIK